MKREPAVPLDALRRTQLVVTEGGPLGPAAFWAGALADRQRAAARTQGPHTPPEVLRVLCYRPTTRTRSIRFDRDRWDALVVSFRPVTLHTSGSTA